MINYRLAREDLVKKLKRKGIKDQRVLEAIQEIKRHNFVPPNLKSRSYEDTPLPIGEDQTISQPYMVAYMTEILELQGDEKVLEIGTGSGYQTVILSKLAGRIFTVERLLTLAKSAREQFARLELNNVVQKIGDGSLGWSELAPFDCIIVTAGAPSIPEKLTQQLAEGGRLLVPSGPRRVQDLKLITKRDGKLITESKGGCVFVPLIGSDGWK